MFCTKCGNKLEDTNKFCTKCGAPTMLHQQTTAIPEMSQTIIPETMDVQSVPGQPVSMQPNPAEQPIPEQPKAEQSNPMQPIPAEQPIPVKPILEQPVSMQPNPAEQPTPVQPILEQTASMQSFPTQPAPTEIIQLPQIRNKRKSLIIAGVCAAVIIVGCGVGYFLYQNNISKQATNVIAYLDEGEYDKAIDLYEKYSGKKEAFDDTVQKELLSRVELVKADYFAEKLDYSTAIDKLQLFKDYDIDELDDATEETTDWIDRIHSSREAFNEGKAYFDQGDYVNALSRYGSVVKEDKKYYDLAAKEIEKAQKEEELRQEEERINEVRTGILLDAADYAYNYDYESAVMIIEQGLMEMPDDLVLMDQLSAYKLLQELTFKVSGITSTGYENTYQDQGKDVMTVSYEFPHLEGDNPAYETINYVFEQLMKEYISYGESMAENAKEYAADEYFYAYSLDMGYSVQYNQDGTLCIMMEGYEYTGGAHGYPIRIVFTFDLATGVQLSLGDLIATDEADFGAYVINEFDRMYNEGETYYWDDAYQTVINSTMDFGTMNYYLTETGICIFYYPYELASYADGFVEINIPYAGNEWMFGFLK